MVFGFLIGGGGVGGYWMFLRRSSQMFFVFCLFFLQYIAMLLFLNQSVNKINVTKLLNVRLELLRSHRTALVSFLSLVVVLKSVTIVVVVNGNGKKW